MSAIENDPGWYERMATRAAARAKQAVDAPFSAAKRENWPVPAEVRNGASARDAFLWYVVDGWRKIYGDGEPVEILLDHDFGLHVLRKGSWQLTLVNTDHFPGHAWPDDVAEEKT